MEIKIIRRIVQFFCLVFGYWGYDLMFSQKKMGGFMLLVIFVVVFAITLVFRDDSTQE